MTDSEHTFSDVARVSSLSGLKGRLLLKGSDSLFYVLESGDTLHFVPPSIDAPRNSTIESIEFDGDAAKVAFSDIDSPEVADMLVGCHCLVQDSLLEGRMDSAQANAFVHDHLVGWTIMDETTGRTFEIASVREYPSQTMLIATEAHDPEVGERASSPERCQAGPSGNGRESMIPFVDDLIVAMDERRSCIRMRLPLGILDL